jgi:hypothetical protein
MRTLAPLVAALALSAALPAQRLIAVEGAFGANRLYDINMATGAATQIGTVSANAGVCGSLTRDPATGTVYLSSTSLHQLFTLDVSTGAATLVGPYGGAVQFMHGLEWDTSTNTLYGAAFSDRGLYRINTATGAATLVGLTGLTGFLTLGHRATTNTMFLTDTNADSLYTVNRANGAVTLIGALAGPTNPAAMAYDSDVGRMFLLDNVSMSLYTVNLATGAATLVGATGAGNLIGLVYVPIAAVPFTIASSCNPNTVFNLQSIPATSTATTEGIQNLRWNGANGQDQLFGNWWAYRAPNDTREHWFNNSATSGFLGTTVSAKGDQAVMRWGNVDGKGFNAELRYRAYSTGATSGVVSECMRISNPTNAPLNLAVFNYADFDVCATAGTDSAVFVQGAPNPQQMITDPACPVQIFFQGCNATAYQTASFATVRTLITNAVVDNLNNTGVPFGPGDWTSAYQWNITVPPNGTVEIYEGLSCGLQIPCCDVAEVEPFCVAKPGTNGAPRWGDNPLYVGGQTELKVLNGFAGSAPIVFVGPGPGVCLPVPPFGTLAIFPLALSFSMPPFNANLVSAACIGLPNDRALCGQMLFMQAWHTDPGAANFPVAHTEGCKFTIGSL